MDPLSALELLENDYNGLVFRVIDLRDYAKAFEAYKLGQKETESSKRPTGPGIERVRKNVFAIQRERLGLPKLEEED